MYTFIGLLSHFETLKSIFKKACKKKKILSFLQQFSNSYLENCSSKPVKHNHPNHFRVHRRPNLCAENIGLTDIA